MTPYIVGIVCGTVITVSPLIYLMNMDRCVAMVLQYQPDFDPGRLDSASALGLATTIAAVGAFVLFISVAMVAITGLRQKRAAKSKTQPESSASAESAESSGAES